MKTRIYSIILSAVCALYLIPSSPVALASGANPYQLVQRGEIKPLEDILQRLRESYRGEIIDIDLEYDDGIYIYEIEMIGPQGQKAEFEFDAATGELISVKGKRLQQMRIQERVLR
ncbi:PepSY domain-containing protein [Aliidiomarina maris]|uniref:Peptidase n=1 Tax=Aliidiomarina maris TaxID=531312 RepID=A0A327WZ47_9GAMM|nr:PepSY domain-containing protein [Aliidiomarina maris]RAJ98443.1 peptidase YpeB-like protein [Aliidiomarina maris]RUO24743.1 peptidase [Aliidiomarina maris]